jgi:pyruvate kinase
VEIRRTKIVCTLGPSTEDPKVMRALVEAGMNVARLNMAHGDHDYHAAMIARAREAARAAGTPLAMLIDIKGPEIRTGPVAGDEPVDLASGAAVTLTVDREPCTAEHISVSYAELPEQVRPGQHVLISDGLIDLEVVDVRGRAVNCLIRSGGKLGSHKNVNLPGVHTRLPAVTDKDVANLEFAVRQSLDFVAASFVRKPEDVQEIRMILRRHDSPMQIVAKIEDEEGLENIDGILQAADAVMIARGDLGVRLPTDQMPLIQKRLVLKCHDHGKPVITATQMLDSMIHNPRPTRAEATDVANAIFDGTDAVMLSGETANGAYPVEALRVMDGIARAVEGSPEYESRVRRFLRLDDARDDIAGAVTRSAFLVARDIRARAILTPTLRGNTPRLLAVYRPHLPVIAVTPSPLVQRQLLLCWGVVPLIGELVDNSDALLNDALRTAIDNGLVGQSDRVVFVGGVPVHSPVMINLIKVLFIGTVLAKGRTGFGGWRTGHVVRAATADAARRRLRNDGTEILVTRDFTAEFLPLVKGLRGVIAEELSTLDLGSIAAEEPELAFIGAVPGAMGQLEDGSTVTLHGEELVVYDGPVAPTVPPPGPGGSGSSPGLTSPRSGGPGGPASSGGSAAGNTPA